MNELPASPCVDVCEMDAVSGWCAGCLRTIDEIAAWSALDAAGKRAVLALLPQRRLQWHQSGDSGHSGPIGRAETVGEQGAR